MRWWAGFALGVFGGWLVGSRVGAVFPQASVGPAFARVRHGDGLLLDERLTRRALARLAERGVVNPRLDVTTVDSVMYLRGAPRDAHEAEALVDVAETTPGVDRVVDELKRPADA